MKIEEIKFSAYVKSYMQASLESPKVFFCIKDMMKMNSEQLFKDMMVHMSFDRDLVKKKCDLEKSLSDYDIYADSDAYCNFMCTLKQLPSKVARSFSAGISLTDKRMLVEALKVYFEEPENTEADYSKDISDLVTSLYLVPTSEEMRDEIADAGEKLLYKLFG